MRLTAMRSYVCAS
jgi:hypothetical protein